VPRHGNRWKNALFLVNYVISRFFSCPRSNFFQKFIVDKKNMCFMIIAKFSHGSSVHSFRNAKRTQSKVQNCILIYLTSKYLKIGRNLKKTLIDCKKMYAKMSIVIKFTNRDEFNFYLADVIKNSFVF
jgi:hypothetical protein